MFHVSRKGDYGLLLVKTLGREGKRFVALKDLAQKERLPFKFLSRIASELTEAGILKSKEGASGGYRLAKAPQSISVADILDVLEGEMELECDRHECSCGGACVHETVTAAATAAAHESLRGLTVADLVGR